MTPPPLWEHVPYGVKVLWSPLKLHEESWNCYPYTNTILSNPPFMKERFHVQNESLHFAGSSTPYNVFGLRELVIKKKFSIEGNPLHWFITT